MANVRARWAYADKLALELLKPTREWSTRAPGLIVTPSTSAEIAKRALKTPAPEEAYVNLQRALRKHE